MNHHMNPLAILRNLSMRFFQIYSPIFAPYAKVGSTKALNVWHLRSHHVTPITTYFLKVVINALTHAIFCLLLDGSR